MPSEGGYGRKTNWRGTLPHLAEVGLTTPGFRFLRFLIAGGAYLAAFASRNLLTLWRSGTI